MSKAVKCAGYVCAGMGICGAGGLAVIGGFTAIFSFVDWLVAWTQLPKGAEPLVYAMTVCVIMGGFMGAIQCTVKRGKSR